MSGKYLQTFSFYNYLFIVADLPKEDPVITGVEMQYQIGDEINLNCTSGKSHPAPILHWYINEQQVNILCFFSISLLQTVKTVYLINKWHKIAIYIFFS